MKTNIGWVITWGWAVQTQTWTNLKLKQGQLSVGYMLRFVLKEARQLCIPDCAYNKWYGRWERHRPTGAHSSPVVEAVLSQYRGMIWHYDCLDHCTWTNTEGLVVVTHPPKAKWDPQACLHGLSMSSGWYWICTYSSWVADLPTLDEAIEWNLKMGRCHNYFKVLFNDNLGVYKAGWLWGNFLTLSHAEAWFWMRQFLESHSEWVRTRCIEMYRVLLCSIGSTHFWPIVRYSRIVVVGSFPVLFSHNIHDHSIKLLGKNLNCD